MAINIHLGDCREVMASLPEESVHTCITSPPYWGLRDYAAPGQLGLEDSPNEYVEHMVEVARGIRRCLRKDGTLWLNLGDSYIGGGNNRGNRSPISDKQASNRGATGQCAEHAKNIRNVSGLKAKDLAGIPWRVALALQDDGWYLRCDIIWSKPNPMPEPVRDRPTKSHEYIFLLSRSRHYYYDWRAASEPVVSITGSGNKSRKMGDEYGRPGSPRGASIPWEPTATRNRRSVWTITPEPFRGAHFATFPTKLVEPCILAGSPVGGTVLDPFSGSGTVALVSARLGRNFVGAEINQEYISMSEERLSALQPVML